MCRSETAPKLRGFIPIKHLRENIKENYFSFILFPNQKLKVSFSILTIIFIFIQKRVVRVMNISNYKYEGLQNKWLNHLKRRFIKYFECVIMINLKKFVILMKLQMPPGCGLDIINIIGHLNSLLFVLHQKLHIAFVWKFSFQPQL